MKYDDMLERSLGLREAVESITEAFQAMEDARVRRRVIVLALADWTGLGIRTIEAALEGVENLDEVMFGATDD